jgi:hypothetical protein
LPSAQSWTPSRSRSSATASLTVKRISDLGLGEISIVGGSARAKGTLHNRPQMEQLVPGSEAHLVLALDHGQFAVLDRDATIDINALTPEAHELGSAVSPSRGARLR